MTYIIKTATAMASLVPRFALWLIVIVSVSACNSGSSGGGDDDTSELTPPNISSDPITVGNVDLSNVSLEAGTADQLDLLLVNGLPADVSVRELHAEFRSTDDSWPVGPGVEGSNIAFMLAAEADGSSYLVVPLIAKADGDDLKLRITDGASYSRTLNLTVGELAQAEPALVDDWVDALEALLVTITDAYELDYPTDLQNYLNTPASIDYEFIPLIKSYHSLVNPDNPNNLRSFTAAMTPDERHSLARLLRQTDAIKEIEDLTRYAASDDTLIADALPHLNATVTEISGEYDAGARTRRITPRSESSYNPVTIDGNSLFSIDGPEELALLLRAYNAARLAQTIEQLQLEYAGYFVAGVGVGAAVVVSGPGGSVVASQVLAGTKGAATVLTGAGVANTLMTATRGLFPCCIIDVAMTLDPATGTVLNEDEADPSLVLEETVAWVHSEGINLMEDVILPLVSSVGADKISDSFSAVSGSVSALDKQIDDISAGLVWSELEADVPAIIFEWVPVNISGDDPHEWVEIDLEGFAATTPMFEQIASANPEQVTYRLDEDVFFYREDSTDVLTVSPDPESFELKTWHPPIPNKSLPIGANTISIDFEPLGIRLDEPDQVVPFTVTVNNAVDTDIELPLTLEPDIGEIDGPSSVNNGVYAFTYTAPPAPLPTQAIRISTKALSTDGVRGRIANPTARIGSLLIKTDAVLVDVNPGSSCMETDDSKTFQAIDPLLGTAVDVTWSAELGTINSQGSYTAPAPQSPGYDTITATATEDGSVQSTARVTFGCSCWWEGSVGGGFAQEAGDWPMGYSLNDAGTAIESLLITSSDDGDAAAIFNLDQPIATGATGTVTARLTGGIFTGSATPDNIWSNRRTFIGPIQRGEGPVAPLLVSVTRHSMTESEDPDDPRQIRDLTLTITGTVYYETGDGEGNAYFEKTGALNISFQGNRWISNGFGNSFRCSQLSPR